MPLYPAGKPKRESSVLTLHPFTSRTAPKRGFCSSAGTISSPVDKIEIFRSATGSFARPIAARTLIVRKSMRLPAGRSFSPSATSSPLPMTFSPACTPRRISTQPPASEVSSSMTTESAPSGSIPPVGIGHASVSESLKSGASPMRTSPFFERKSGVPGVAPAASRWFTA